jgi:hypothetical protein
MAEAHQFFVVVFSRTEAKRIRTEAVIKALSEQHATWVASHFVGEGEGAIVLSRSESVPPGMGTDKILARFGAVPDESNVWIFLGRASGILGLANPVARVGSVTDLARVRQPRIMLSVTRRRRPRRGP